jgi:hypothetical protein
MGWGVVADLATADLVVGDVIVDTPSWTAVSGEFI